MHLRSLVASLLACLLQSGCASSVLPGHFHVDPVVLPVTSGPATALAAAIHDAAVRSGRAEGWNDASADSVASIRLAYAWRPEAGAASDRFRLVCHWRTSRGGAGEITDGQSMPAHFWTETRAAEAAARLCAATLRTCAAHGPRHAP